MSENKMNSFIGMILVMGIDKVPELEDYWSLYINPLLGVPGIWLYTISCIRLGL